MTQNLDRFKFRARILEEKSGYKSYKKGDFIEGYFYEEVEDNEDSYNTFLHDYYIKTNYGDHFTEFKIDVKTLGQSTGLKDKNGKLIYEGDIIKETEGCVFEVQFNRNSAGFIFIVRKSKSILKYHETPNWIMDRFAFEVLGNIHENPELIEETNQ